ncbi:MAG: hypothetical protein AUK54_04385 [Helicobacteraceae bacterium CG2_30_36_10]|nr:MAG: hypothetical protein AUK54_04385 [Helicobacteraceae bacterium CG2_30_36_10]
MKRKAFSLIELMIVIMIIGVIYTLAITNFAKLSDKSSMLTLSNFKEYLIGIPHAKSAKIFCLDDCSQCDILVDGNKTKTIENFLDDSVRVYGYDFSYGFMEVQKEVYFNIDNVEENVCFSYEVDKNGVGNQVLIEFKDKFYDMSTYFTKTPIYDSMQDAVEAREALVREVMK